MAQIYLVRHTNVDVPKGVCYGISDVSLASTYNQEIQAIIQHFIGISFNNVYSSPLSRCTQLAQQLSPSGFRIDARLKELNFGDWEGSSWDEIYKTAYGKKWMNNYLELPCPAGEAYSDLYNRVSAFINEMDKSQDTLIITHAGVIRVFLSVFKIIEGKSIFDRKVDFGEIIRIHLT